MKETAISNPIIAVNKANGIKVMKNTKILVENNLIKKDDKIARSVWPATILANSRRPRLTDLAKYEINSINTNKGTNAAGQPFGTKNEKNLIPCLVKANIVTLKNIVTESPKQTIAELVTAKLYATLDTKLDTKINRNRL